MRDEEENCIHFTTQYFITHLGAGPQEPEQPAEMQAKA